MKEFAEDLRYDYPLTPDSWVIDIGAHKGQFSRIIGQRYNCNILAFEPIDQFWKEAIQDQTPKTQVLRAGIGDSFRTELFKIQGDMTGAWASSDEEEIVTILPASCLNFKQIDLMKINAEGAEYEIVKELYKFGMLNKFTNLQIQFHTVGHCGLLKCVNEALEITHHQTWEPALGWHNWELNQ